ncbi:hypothetical protein Hanom_Chr01g00055151 [Helianthus anomalus]
MYPLELLAVQNEMIQFYIEDDPSKRTFPSLQGFNKPQNIDEYLKMKAKQAELISKAVCKGKSDIDYQGTYQRELSKVRKLEDFARDLSKSMSELPPNVVLQKELRIDYLDIIMRDKPYKAYRSHLKDLSPEDLKEERSELVAAGCGAARSIGRWSKQNVDLTYKKLEELRKTDPTLPKKPVYDDETTDRPQQTLPSKKLFSSSDVSISVLNQRKIQQLIDEEDEKRDAEFRKEAIKNQLQYGLNEASLQLQAQFAETIQRLASIPLSPNSSQIKLPPGNPSDPKILKWKSDKDTHVLTLLRSNGSVEKLTKDDALGLNASDL